MFVARHTYIHIIHFRFSILYIYIPGHLKLPQSADPLYKACIILYVYIYGPYIGCINHSPGYFGGPGICIKNGSHALKSPSRSHQSRTSPRTPYRLPIYIYTLYTVLYCPNRSTTTVMPLGGYQQLFQLP